MLKADPPGRLVRRNRDELEHAVLESQLDNEEGEDLQEDVVGEGEPGAVLWVEHQRGGVEGEYEGEFQCGLEGKSEAEEELGGGRFSGEKVAEEEDCCAVGEDDDGYWGSQRT